MPTPVTPVKERVKRHSRIDPVTGCWVWTSPLKRGYGRLRVGPRHEMAHRAAFEAWVGPIPAGLQLDHLCRNPSCVNPAHLEPVTPRENQRRSMAGYGTRTLCRNGLHDVTDPANVSIQRSPTRTWRTCAACLAASRLRRRSKS